MKRKFILKLDAHLIKKARAYAESQRIDLSNLIEDVLRERINEKGDGPYLTPLVKSLSGIIDYPGDEKMKNAYFDYLKNKYK